MPQKTIIFSYFILLLSIFFGSLSAQEKNDTRRLFIYNLTVDQKKANGKSWDSGKKAAAPDIKIRILIKKKGSWKETFKSSVFKDSYKLTQALNTKIDVKKGTALKIEVLEEDLVNNDAIGSYIVYVGKSHFEDEKIHKVSFSSVTSMSFGLLPYKSFQEYSQALVEKLGNLEEEMGDLIDFQKNLMEEQSRQEVQRENLERKSRELGSGWDKVKAAQEILAQEKTQLQNWQDKLEKHRQKIQLQSQKWQEEAQQYREKFQEDQQKWTQEVNKHQNQLAEQSNLLKQEKAEVDNYASQLQEQKKQLDQHAVKIQEQQKKWHEEQQAKQKKTQAEYSKQRIVMQKLLEKEQIQQVRLEKALAQVTKLKEEKQKLKEEKQKLKAALAQEKISRKQLQDEKKVLAKLLSSTPVEKTEPSSRVESKEKIDPVHSETKEEAKEKTAKVHLPTYLYSVQENRIWKSEDKNMTQALRSVYLSRSMILLKLFAKVPQNSIGYGNFHIAEASDDKGRALEPLSNDLKKWENFSPYERASIEKGEGNSFSFRLAQAARDTKSFTLKGHFQVKTGNEASSITLKKSYSTLKTEEHEMDLLPHVKLKFKKSTSSRSISMDLKGDRFHLISVVPMSDGEPIKWSSSSWSQIEGGYRLGFWYRADIPDNAELVINYYKTIGTQTLGLNVEKETLP